MEEEVFDEVIGCSVRFRVNWRCRAGVGVVLKIVRHTFMYIGVKLTPQGCRML